MIRYISGLTRAYDYVKIHKGEADEFVPCMTITRDRCKGRSFMITLDALWKYDDPMNNQDAQAVASDMEEFQVLIDKHEFRRRLSARSLEQKRVEAEDACISVALIYNKGMGLMLCTGYNLAKLMQMMEISPMPQAAAQLLMWIQDGLDQLKNMPEHGGEDKMVAGEVILFESGRKIGTRPLEVTESELMEAEE